MYVMYVMYCVFIYLTRGLFGKLKRYNNTITYEIKYERYSILDTITPESIFQAFSMERHPIHCLPPWHIANPPCNTLISPLPKCIMSHGSSSTGLWKCASLLTPVAGCAMRCTTPETRRMWHEDTPAQSKLYLIVYYTYFILLTFHFK